MIVILYHLIIILCYSWFTGKSDMDEEDRVTARRIPFRGEEASS